MFFKKIYFSCSTSELWYLLNVLAISEHFCIIIDCTVNQDTLWDACRLLKT